MTSLPLARTEHMNRSTGTPRTGATSHGESLTDMESYLIRQDQMSTSTLHSWGVAEGLSVSAAPDPASLTIRPGVAVDSAGHLISLADDGFAIIDPNVDPGQVSNVPTVPVTEDGVILPTTGLTGDRYLTITWREVLEPGTAGTAPTLLHTPWLRLQPVADVPDDGVVVILAHVILGEQSQVAALTADHRRLVGVPAGRVELRRPRTSAGPPATVDQLPTGEIRANDGGGFGLNLVSPNGTVQQMLAADPTGNLALVPASGNVGVGLRGTPPRRTVHVEGSEVHSGGPTGGFSFSSRTTASFVENPNAGERWMWYASAGTARLWSGSDRLTIASDAVGMRLQAGTAGAPLELGAHNGAVGKLALTANAIVARTANGVEPIFIDTVNGRLGVGTGTPTHPLHVAVPTGIRQNSLYLSGGPGWSSLSYNAFHGNLGSPWVFPDPARPAVTLEIDDSSGSTPRFGVFTTTTANKQAWQLRLGIDGNTGTVTIPGKLNMSTGGSSGPLSVTSSARVGAALEVSNHAGTTFCAFSNNTEFTTAQILSGGLGLFVSGRQAAHFNGDVRIVGTLEANSKLFVIDHPLDPENRYLNHVGIESDELAVVYSGNIECDAKGNATVALPDWLEALAGDFRYQLTCVGGQSDVYVSDELRDNRFGIGGGTAGQRVSWQVTGIRHDAWAKNNDFVVEEDKPENERGFYRNPEAFGQDLTGSVLWVQHEEIRKQHPRLAQQVVRNQAEHEAKRLQAQTERRQASSS